jgi:hypothetical protein
MEMLAFKTPRGPNRERNGWKTKYWTTPFKHPYQDIHKPMDAGLMPSPPNSTDVDQTSGMSALAAAVRRESIASLEIETMTGLVRMARSGGGFSAPFGDLSGDMLAESSPAGFEPVLEG